MSQVTAGTFVSLSSLREKVSDRPTVLARSISVGYANDDRSALLGAPQQSSPSDWLPGIVPRAPPASRKKSGLRSHEPKNVDSDASGGFDGVFTPCGGSRQDQLEQSLNGVPAGTGK